MQVVILCGGKGSRLGYVTKDLPKPLIPIQGKPIVVKIMEHYAKYGHKDFLLLTGYKQKEFEKTKWNKDWKVQLLPTGVDSSKGDRLRKAIESNEIDFDEDDDVLLSYGDDICKVDINDVVKMHKSSDVTVTLTCVRPISDFGVVRIDKKGYISNFEEKPNLPFWINGGYMVVNKLFFKTLFQTHDETDALSILAGKNKVRAYTYIGYWKSINTIKDLEDLESEIG